MPDTADVLTAAAHCRTNRRRLCFTTRAPVYEKLISDKPLDWWVPLSASPLWNPDLAPTTRDQRTWSTYKLVPMIPQLESRSAPRQLRDGRAHHGGQVAHPDVLDRLYTYSWSVTFALSAVIYLALMPGPALGLGAGGHKRPRQVDTSNGDSIAGGNEVQSSPAVNTSE